MSTHHRVEKRRGMFRAVTSIVSILSGFVAKWPPALAPVSSSPSKIPYGGFSPVRLQTDTDLQRRPSSASKLIRRLQRLSRTPMALSAFIRVPLTPRASPEALGSPTGYAVPPAHRLLWPHLRLSSPPDRLFLVGRAYSSSLDQGDERFPNLLHASFPACSFSYPDALDDCT